MVEVAGFRIADYGDSGLLVDFSEQELDQAWLATHTLANRLREMNMKGIKSVIPTYASVYVHFNCARLDRQTLIETITELAVDTSESSAGDLEQGRHFRIPVLFGTQWGEDLPKVAAQLGISQTEVVDLFCSKAYKIMCLASPIGQPLLDAPPFEKEVSRLPSPRTLLPAGSLAVAGRQACIYTLESPGGWQLIGQTPIKLVHLEQIPPVHYKPGDFLQFFPIAEKEFDLYKGKTVLEMEVSE